MRRACIGLAVLAVVSVMSSPAFAHETGGRDPFQPAGGFQVPGGAPQGDAGSVQIDIAPVVEPGPRRGLPGTGASLDAWILLAYLLVASGAGALLWVWSRKVPRPVPG